MVQPRQVTCLLAAAILAGAASIDADEPAGDGGTLVTKIDVKSTDFDDLGELLHVVTRAGTFELRDKIRAARLVVEFYKDGVKLDGFNDRAGIGVDVQEAVDRGQFAVHLIDLDYLPLAGGKPGYFRIECRLGLGTTVGGSHDVMPKDRFDVARGASGHPFGPRAAGAKRAPLFCLLARSKVFYTGGTVEEVLAKNPRGDLLVASLLIDDVPPGK
jgi:hypothetical protein